jgi:hypothetical protein
MYFSWAYYWLKGNNPSKRIKYIKWEEKKAEKEVTEYLS